MDDAPAAGDAEGRMDHAQSIEESQRGHCHCGPTACYDRRT